MDLLLLCVRASQDLKGNIRVYCRIRPLSPAEAPAGTQLSLPTTGLDTDKRLELTVPAAESALSRGPARHSFTLDRVFGPHCGQGEVFEEVSQVVQSAIDGFKVCIFAYGQTGSGKTHTMIVSPLGSRGKAAVDPLANARETDQIDCSLLQGTGDQPGMIGRSLTMMFDRCAALHHQGWRFELSSSMLEIYNETIKDLLVPKDDKEHKITFDGRVAASYPEKARGLGPGAGGCT